MCAARAEVAHPILRPDNDAKQLRRAKENRDSRERPAVFKIKIKNNGCTNYRIDIHYNPSFLDYQN